MGRGRPRQTHCKRGHEFTEENSALTKRGRTCRACKKIHQDAWRERQKVLFEKYGVLPEDGRAANIHQEV